MHVNLPLEEMTIADKLEVMELLWSDISKRGDNLPSPTWHRYILSERRRLVVEGKLKFQDWDTALTELREELREDPAT